MNWLIQELGTPDCISKHVVACSTALAKTKAFGIDDANVFGFWDWVGGRFSVCSAVGVLPLSLQYGFDTVRLMLDGAHAMDKHFTTAPPMKNLPILLGLLTVWNATVLGHETYAVLPYCQALTRFVAHIQQLDMESNGKRVQMDGSVCSTSTGAVYFGEPCTNGQHSFYQLCHQGRTVPADFIGFRESQNPIFMEGEVVSNHDELMSNYFAQPDALALGKTDEECRAEGIPEKLVPHKVFTGNRPSLSLLLPECSPFHLGALLAMYEHRTAVQGWVWGINSFDQWGVELGKVLGVKCRTYLSAARGGSGDVSIFQGPTQKLMSALLTSSLNGASAPLAYQPSGGTPSEIWQKLRAAAVALEGTHLRDLLKDESRCNGMLVEAENFVLDYSRQRVTPEIMTLLQDLAQGMALEKKRASMFSGEKINQTEGRAVLHCALRAPKDQSISVDGVDQVD